MQCDFAAVDLTNTAESSPLASAQE